jgi:membrane protein
LLAVPLWLAASLLFSFYVENFGAYNETFGSLAAVAILLMWFFISAFVILLGAELNSEVEKQGQRTRRTRHTPLMDPRDGDSQRDVC